MKARHSTVAEPPPVPPQFQAVLRLSPTQYGIFIGLGDGMRTSDLARKTGRSMKTIETQIAHIKHKLNLKSIEELRSIAAKFVALVGKPQLSEKIVTRQFVFEGAPPL